MLKEINYSIRWKILHTLLTKFPCPSFSPRSIYRIPSASFLIRFEDARQRSNIIKISRLSTHDSSHRFPTKFGEESLRDTSFTAFPTDQSRPTPDPSATSPLVFYFLRSPREFHLPVASPSVSPRCARQWLRISVVAHTYLISSVSSAFDGAEDAARLPPVAVGKARLAALCHHGDYIAVSARNIESHCACGMGEGVEEEQRQTGMNAQYVARGVAYSTRRYFESLLKHRDASFVGLKTRILGRIFVRQFTGQCAMMNRGYIKRKKDTTSRFRGWFLKGRILNRSR